MGGPPSHIQSLRAGGDQVRGQGEDTGPMVAADGSGSSTEVHAKIYLEESREQRQQESGMSGRRGDQQGDYNGK